MRASDINRLYVETEHHQRRRTSFASADLTGRDILSLAFIRRVEGNVL
jgi:hypothetical protein